MKTKQLSHVELETAKQMNEQGITWSIVAAFYKTTTTRLREQIKHYENTNE